MILLVYFGLLLVIFSFRRSPSPALFLVAIYLFSLVCGALIGFDYEISTIFEGFNLLFVAVMLTLLIAPWHSFPFRVELDERSDKRVRRLTWFLLGIHSIGFVVFSIAFYYAVTTVSDYSAFKNDGENATFYASLPINHTLLVLVTYLNSTAAFLVPLHFYHFLKRRFLLSLLCFIFSLNLVLEGITIFSRSTLVFYSVLYLMYLPFFYRRFDRRQRRALSAIGLVAVTLLGATFYQITNNRFGGYFSWGDAVYSTSSIQNPLVYSVLDYASQWYRNGSYVMASYSFNGLNGGLSLPLVATIGNKLGVISYSPDAIPIKLEALWGDRFDDFVGLVANLVFDFGYAGTVLFVLLYVAVLRGLRPVKGSISVASLITLGPLFLLPAMGIQNSVMKMTGYNLLLIYSVAVYAYLYSGVRKYR